MFCTSTSLGEFPNPIHQGSDSLSAFTIEKMETSFDNCAYISISIHFKSELLLDTPDESSRFPSKR